ncbi:MAG: Gfo/Idh/MocA family oxidoreductase [Gemmataceae bacterium]
MPMNQNLSGNQLRAGMVGVGMIFEETYWPFFRQVHRQPLFSRATGPVDVDLAAVASRTGTRARAYVEQAQAESMPTIQNLVGPDAIRHLVESDVHAVCIATPDDRHFEPARQALLARKHVLLEKPSVLTLSQLDELNALAQKNDVLCRVVYHKLADPDHKKLRTHVQQHVLRHVNNGYCSLLEPKSISGSQFAEWIIGRNPGTYVAVHYIKLIDFTFGGVDPWSLVRVTATGQRGLVGPALGPTWDSVQLQMVYRYADGREAAFDIHTSWVTPDNFPGYVEQEVQFRFDNGVWAAHQRKRGVELTVEERSPHEFKYTPNHHYNGKFIEPWNEPSQRGYGIEIIARFFEEVGHVEFGGPASTRSDRLQAMRQLAYSDASSDRNTVATVQAMEQLLASHAAGHPAGVVQVNDSAGGLALYLPGRSEPEILYSGRV